uniref:Uncharacterized protein n=1 Tax=Romanomermis culicivorax TaxID=13658 RepID=A0A915ILE8_ROMCU
MPNSRSNRVTFLFEIILSSSLDSFSATGPWLQSLGIDLQMGEQDEEIDRSTQTSAHYPTKIVVKESKIDVVESAIQTEIEQRRMSGVKSANTSNNMERIVVKHVEIFQINYAMIRVFRQPSQVRIMLKIQSTDLTVKHLFYSVKIYLLFNFLENAFAHTQKSRRSSATTVKSRSIRATTVNYNDDVHKKFPAPDQNSTKNATSYSTSSLPASWTSKTFSNDCVGSSRGQKPPWKLAYPEYKLSWMP